MSAKKHTTLFPALAIGLACAASLVAPSPACGEPVILWNKLGSDAEVTNSEIGSDGIIVGDISYGPGQFDNGFQPEWRTGDHNIPDNYVRFNDLNLGQQGTIEFWFHPDWIAPGYSHCRDILWYGKANPNRRCLLYFQYNDWQNRLNLYLFDDYLTSAFVKRFIVPANTPEWSTTEPFHVAITWDGTAADNADKLKLFLNGNERGALASSGAPTFDDWDNTNYMCLASRTIEGDWVRHNWEGSDGIIDNIKIWDYAKTDFSDRFVEGVLLPCQANELAKLLASDGAEEDVFGYGVAISGDTAVIGAKRDDDNGSNSGSAYVFQFDGSGWVQQAKLLASDGAANDEFGTSVAISGNTIVVGATRKVDYRGSAYVYERPVGGWADMTETARLSPSDTLASGDRFGIVAISGDTVVVTAHRYDQNGLSESGTAYLYVKPPGGWVDMMSQTAKLTASDLAAYDMCGSGVGIDGDTVVVNSADDNENGVDAGSAYVFEKPPGGWVNMTETAKLTASDGAAVDQMGWFSAVISGNTVVLGAPWDDNENGTKAGSAYVYEKPPGGWVNMTETAKLMASDGAPGDELGFGVAVSGDTLVVGAYEDDDNGDGSGSAYVFQRPAGGWVATTESAKLTASDGAPGDHFGCYFSVSVSGDTAMAGAYGDDDNGSGSGSVYVFRGLGDCNENGTLDICDVAEGTSADINANGVPDECETAELSCLESAPVIVPGGAVSFDVFVADVTALNAYQIDVEVVRTSGTGELLFNECLVDEARPDFVFFGLNTYVDANCSPGDLRITVVAGGSQTVDVPEGSPAYLGTYVFDVSVDATNASTFELRIKPEPDSLLLNEYGTLHLLAPEAPCETVVCEAPAVVAEGGRYLQVAPNQPGSLGDQALRVTSPSCPTWTKYVAADGCLVDTPEFLTAVQWDTVHVTGDDIVPSFDYEVAAACDDVDTFSSAVPVTTWLWGDVNNDLVVNLIDIQKVVQCCEDTLIPPTTIYNADLITTCAYPECDLVDLMYVQSASRDGEFPGSDPCGPPLPPAEGDPTQTPAVLTLVPVDSTLGPGNVFVVEAFINDVGDLRGYQLELSIAGGSAGSLECEQLLVDTSRLDYVFFEAEAADWPWTNLSRSRLSSSLTEGGVDVAVDPKYLGTFMLRSTADAEGSFFANLAESGSASMLRNSVCEPILFDVGSVELSVVVIPGDLDLDADVDLSDFATFALCYGGAGVTVPPSGCSEDSFCSSDIDLDGDVDLSDFAVFALNYTG